MASADPYLAQLQAMLSAASVSDAAQRKRGVQQAVIDYGAVPDLQGLGTIAGDIDDVTRQLAQQNTASGLSFTARSQAEHERQKWRVPDVLASRGMTNPYGGELPYAVGQEGLRFKTEQSDATRKLLDYLGGAQQAWAEAERQRTFQLAQEQQQSAIRAQDLQMAQQAQAQAAADSGFSDTGSGDGGQGFLDELFASLYPPQEAAPAGPAAGGSPTPWQVKRRNTIAHKAARNRTAEEKQWLADYNARFGGGG